MDWRKADVSMFVRQGCLPSEEEKRGWIEGRQDAGRSFTTGMIRTVGREMVKKLGDDTLGALFNCVTLSPFSYL